MRTKTMSKAGSKVRGIVVPAIQRPREITADEFVLCAAPQPGLSNQVNEDRARHFADYLAANEQILWALRKRIPMLVSSLFAQHVDRDGTVLASRLCGHHSLTKVGAAKAIAAMVGDDPTTIGTFIYHGIGTGATAEAFSDTALVTELTTEYLTDNTRATGSQEHGGDTNIYESNAVIAVKTAPAATIKEHGLFSAAARGSGVLFDRTKTGFGPFTLLASQNLQVGYDFTLTAA